jgi:hypothetical protein
MSRELCDSKQAFTTSAITSSCEALGEINTISLHQNILDYSYSKLKNVRSPNLF